MGDPKLRRKAAILGKGLGKEEEEEGTWAMAMASYGRGRKVCGKATVYCVFAVAQSALFCVSVCVYVCVCVCV